MSKRPAGIAAMFARATQKQKKQQEAHGDGEEGTGAGGGGSKDQGKLGAADAAAVTAAELGEEIAEHIMETVLRVRSQVEGTASTAQAACASKVADCQAILQSMQEKVVELMEKNKVLENKSSWLPSWVSGLALSPAFVCC